MVRSSLTIACVLGLPVSCLLAEDHPPAESKHPSPPQESPAKPGKSESGDAESLKKAVRSLSPDQKQRVQENIKAWKQLTPQEQEKLRDRDATLHKQALEEIAPLVKEMTPEQREAFTHRYIEERRKLQLVLRQEMETRRKAAVAELQQRLKQDPTSTTPETESTPPATAPKENP